MAKQLNVNLAFTADTGKAKAQLQDLQKSLDKLIMTSSKTTSNGLGMTKDIISATHEVAKLQSMLEASKNVSGGLDLGKFNQSLQKSKTNLSDYAKILSSLGPQGEQAFAGLAKSIINAEVPLKKTNKLLNEFKVSLANTARWQLSSSMLHGFMGAVQTAYGYVQDLNESLNNIRIVTGFSADEMTEFARQANESAKALSATTTEYTNAALIYYQQGLNEQQVKERTDVTIKMANAAGVSAEKASQQLTAIWNNFAKGGQNLEYYADVLTALGAATASSTDEISGGLEKFAGVAETVGLSYEYAASALATITATSRESEEVVGTALKTIFARIQGLSLGETLEDGVDLNKYSEALAKIGVDVLNADGSLKAMDQTLEDLASKWNTLTNAEQVATAQAIAGVRQYNQLTTLMNNWDFMEQNLIVAQNSSGSLQEQADIYAESWEAAKDRVTAAAQEIYSQLLNDKFFINLNNGFAGFLNIVSNTIDTLGGLPGVLSLASGIMFKMFGKEMAQAIDDWGYNIKLRSEDGLKSILAMRQKASQALKELYADTVDDGPVTSSLQTSFESQTKISDSLLLKKQQLLAIGQSLSAEDENQAQQLLKINEALSEQSIEASKVLEQTKQQEQLLEKQISTQARRYNKSQSTDPKKQIDLTNLQKEINSIKEQQIQYSSLESIFNKLQVAKKNFSSGNEVIEQFEMMSQAAADAGMDMTFFNSILAKLSSGMTVEEVLNTIEREMYEIGDAAYEGIEGAKGLREQLLQIGMSNSAIDALINSWQKEGIITADLAEKLKNVKTQGEEAVNIINKMQGPPPTVGQKFIAVANTISNIAMSINMVKGLIDTWNNEDMSFGEKLISTFTTLGMVIPMVTTALTGNNLALLGSASASIATALGFDGVAISASVAAGGVGALWAALWPIALIMGAVALAAWGLHAAFKSIEENSPEGQLKQTKEEARELNEALTEATQAAEELKSAFDGYDSAVEALENCTEGTQEWYNALRDVNNEVLSLLSSYPELASMVNEETGEKAITKGDDGEFVVADWAKEQLIDQANQAVLNTQVASSRANRNVRDAELKVQRSELASSINNRSGTTASKTYQGETVDVSSMVSSYIAENAEALSSMTTGQQTEALKSYFESNDINADVGSWVSAITDLGTEFGQLASAVEANTAATQLENEILTNEILAENKAVQASDYTDQIASVAGHDLDKLVDSKEQELIDSGWGTNGISKATGVNDEARKIFAEYAEAADITNYDLTDTTGTDANRAFVYTDENNESVTVTLDAMRAVVAAAEANTEVANNATNLVEAFSDKTESEVAEMTAAVTQDVKDLTVAQTQEGYKVTQLSPEDLKALGFETQAEYEEAFNQLAEGASSALSSIIDDYVQSVQDSMNALKDSGALNDLTLEEVDALGSTMEEVFTVGGQAALDNFANIFESIDTAERDEFVNTLSSIDWQTTNVDNLKQKLEEAGVSTTNLSEGALQSLIDTMQSGAMGLEAAVAKYASLHDIINGLQTGDIISEEQFNKFEEYGIAAEDYFLRMADGTYKLIGDAEEFYNKVNSESLEGFENNIAAAQESNAKLENINMSTISQQANSYYAPNLGKNVVTSAGKEQAQMQLDFLSETGYDDTAQLAQWNEDLANGKLGVLELSEAVEKHIENLGGMEAAEQAVSDAINQNNSEMDANREGIASTAKSVDELNDLLTQGKITTKEYDKALQAAFENEIEAEGFDSKELNDYAEALMDSSDALVETREEANRLAIAHAEMERGINALVDNWDGWTEALESGNFKEQTVALDSMRDAMSDIIGVDPSQISDGFLQSAEAMDLMEKAAQGDMAALDALGPLFAKSYILDLEVGDTQFEADLLGLMDQVQADIDNGTLTIGTSLDTSGYAQAMTEMMAAAGTDIETINNILAGMGFEPEVTYIEVPASEYSQMIQNSQTQYTDPLTGTTYTAVLDSNLISEGEDTVRVPVINGSKTTFKGSGSSAASSGAKKGGNKGGGGGGGGSKPKKAEPTKKSDVVERYKELEDQLDDVRKEADHTRNSLDRLYGEEQEAAIERLLELERQEIELIKEKKREAEKYLQEDLKELKKVSAQVDVEFEFDKEGNISNYEEEMTELYEELHRVESAAGSEWDENEQEEIDTLKEKISKLEEAIAAYEETKELLQDINYELDEMAGTPPLPLIKSDYLDIYLEVEDKLDDIEEKISDLERQAEGLTGEARLEVLRQIQELEEERLKTLEEQKEIARQDMEDKKAAMEEIAERNDLNFEYDENGNITNYISEMEKLNKAYEELYDEVTEDGLVTDTELAALDAMREDMEQMEEYAQGYRQAMEAVEDIQNEIEEKGSGKTNDRFVRSDHIDIYKETNDQLDDIDEKIADLEREADRLTGDERIAKLREIQKLEKQRLDILKKQKDIAKKDMEDRKAALEEIATLNELIFEYDENGNITNYDEQMDKLIKKYEDAYTEFMEDGVITDTEQAILDAIDQDIQELEDAIDAYSDAVEEMEDIQNEMEEIAEGGYVDMDQLDEIGDKLHDINQELDDIEEAINDSAKAADRLYGAARIKQMDKTTKMLEEEIDALERKKELQKEIVAEEKSELDEFSKGQVKYDSNGNITNYHDLVDGKKDEIRAKEAELKADGDFTEAEAAEIQEMIDELERLEEEIDEYEQALEDQEDIENAIDDAYYEWQDLNAEKLSYKLELTLDVNDRELAKIERQINRLEGNFYSRAEALALMVGGGMNGNSKLGELNSQLGDLQAHYAEVKQAYEAGEISHADYVAQTQQIQAEIENTAAAMEDLQAQMDSYYKDTLAQARQELSFYTAQMEHLTGVLGHFKNILTTLGKSQDYDMMGVVLEGQVETLENEVQVAKKAMGMWQQEADEAYAKYQQALASGNQENANMYYQAYQEALNAANEAENKYYSKAQQWAQALKALMENTLAGLGQDLENALTGGTSFETVNTSLKRAASLQEEYLTTTNKIYETTKMMRTAQNEIDKTTNSVAKRKLANFITETKQMQNQNKLSKYELSIQQAKYDLLLAEIALEEARYAKSTVRLQRDSEGNFGYVYTADAEAINNAEQQFEDAQNKLYNIGLDGANKYTEKYQQTMAEMYDTLTDLQNKYLQGGFESEEEYNAAVTEAKEYYYEKLQQYSDLYSIALTTDSRVVADAWSTDFADMTQRTEEWMNAVTDYLGQVREAFAEWERESDRIANETVGTNLDTLKQKVGGIVSESEVLTGTINNSVIPAIQAEIDEVQRLTDAYANMAGSMQGAIDKAYELSDALQKDIDASVEQEMSKQDQETDTEENPTENEPVEQNPTENEPTDPGGTTEPPPTENPDAGEPEGETEPPHTHSYGDWKVTEKASCTKSGKKERKCACGDVKTETIPKKGHKAGSKWKYDKEYHWHECTECGAKMDKAKHTIKDGKCSVCGYKPDSKSNNILEVGDTPIYKSGKYYHDSYGTDPAGSRGQGKKVKVTQVIKNPKSGQDYPIHVESNDSAYGWLKASQLEGYDTGGYTGAWGPFGKLAMLHEKELILNKEDTENFLASLELLDSILSTIDLHAMNSQFNTMINSPYIPDLGKETLEQMVSIEASFPNATDKQEIEDAFKSLVNLASQYANRK